MDTGGQQGVSCEGSGQNETCTAPVLQVTGQGPSADQAEDLARELNVSGSVEVSDDGGIRYIEPDALLSVPTEDATLSSSGTPSEDEEATETRAFDEAALAEIEPVSADAVEARFRSALESADLDVPGEVEASHGVLTLGDQTGSSTDYEVDTTAVLQATRNGLPVEGPGASIELTLNHQDEVGMLLYEMRELRSGSSVEVHPPDEGDAICRDELEDEKTIQGEALESVDSELVYYAPPQDLTSVSKLVPHFRCSGTLSNGAKIRPSYVPATVAAPEADVSASAQDEGGTTTVSAQVSVTGGQSPFTYSWSSEVTTLGPEQASGGDSIQYTVESRTDVSEDTVAVTVVDANGRTFQAAQTVDLPDSSSGASGAGADAPTDLRLSGPDRSKVGHGDVGAATEWVGSAASPPLSGSSGNAAGWVRQHKAAGTTVDFNWGNRMAWERDFKDPSNGGNDQTYVDDTDFAWYTGHANAVGWTFPGNKDDGFLRNTEAAYGEKDIEWLTIAACGPLQDRSQDTVWDRWGSAFQGLHLLTGYASLSNDNQREGQTLANLLHGEYGDLGYSFDGPGLTVVDAWYLTARDIQPSKYTLAIMGVMDQNGVTNWNDHFHGEGSVGPDIDPAEQSKWWVYRSST